MIHDCKCNHFCPAHTETSTAILVLERVVKLLKIFTIICGGLLHKTEYFRAVPGNS